MKRNRPLGILNINFRSAIGSILSKAQDQTLLLELRPGWTQQAQAQKLAFRHKRCSERTELEMEAACSLLCLTSSSALKNLTSSSNCEIIWVRVKSQGRRSFLIRAYYRPHVGDEASLRALSQSAEKACKSRNGIVLLGGDFNLPGWDWGSMTLKKGTPYPSYMTSSWTQSVT